MKKYVLFALSALLALGLSACGTDAMADTAQKPVGGSGGSVQVANPFATCDTLEEVEEIAGFAITLPDEGPAWEHEIVYRATVAGDMLEIIYASEDDEIRIRKAPVSRENISGIYDAFSVSEEVSTENFTVTLKGDGEVVNLALWSVDDYNYFIHARKGLAKEEMLQWVLSVA